MTDSARAALDATKPLHLRTDDTCLSQGRSDPPQFTGDLSAARVGSSLPDAYRLVSYVGDNGQIIYLLQGYFTWTQGCERGGEWRSLKTQSWLHAEDGVPFDCLGKRPTTGGSND